MLRIIVVIMFIFQLSSGVNAQESNSPDGYILSVWAGFGQSQTYTIYVFEGTDDEARCDGAKKAVKSIDDRFNNKYTVCIPYYKSQD